MNGFYDQRPAAVSFLAALLLVVHTAAAASEPIECRSGLSLEKARKRIPELTGLSDESALDVINKYYYPSMDREALAELLCYTIPPAFQPTKLGVIARWRYENCLEEAAKAPTDRGVGVGLGLCRKKYGQSK